jgi:alpha-galactosidase
MACHVTVVPNHQTHRVTPLKYRFDVAMSGRLGFELHPKNMSAEDVAFAKKAVAEYKTFREVVQHGDLYRLANPYKNDYASIMYASEDKKKAVVFVWGLNRLCSGNFPAPIFLDGLDESQVYSIREINKVNDRAHSFIDGQTLGGDLLKKQGIFVALAAEYDSAVFVLEAKKK